MLLEANNSLFQKSPSDS